MTTDPKRARRRRWAARAGAVVGAFVVGCTAADWAEVLDDSTSGPSEASDLDSGSSGYGGVPPAPGYGGGVAPAPGYGGSDEYRYSQPRMSSALDHLREARSELQQADTNKGGYRKDAIDHVEAAIEAVQTGMQYDATH